MKKIMGYWNAPFLKREKDAHDIDLSCLVGKKIVALGRLDLSGFPPYTTNEADFAIDYLDGKTVKRLVFGANDCGWWNQWNGLAGTPNSADKLKSKLTAIWDDLPLSDELKIVDKPTERRYSFVGPKEKEEFSLSIEDLKCMPEYVQKHFTSSGSKNVTDVVSAIDRWVLAIE